MKERRDRLMDHMDRGKINFSRVEMFVLDEADRMLDMGFIGPVEEIAEAIEILSVGADPRVCPNHEQGRTQGSAPTEEHHKSI